MFNTYTTAESFTTMGIKLISLPAIFWILFSICGNLRQTFNGDFLSPWCVLEIGNPRKVCFVFSIIQRKAITQHVIIRMKLEHWRFLFFRELLAVYSSLYTYPFVYDFICLYFQQLTTQHLPAHHTTLRSVAGENVQPIFFPKQYTRTYQHRKDSRCSVKKQSRFKMTER